MARYFKAPNVVPVDYGYDLPFQQMYGAVKMAQKEHDDLASKVSAMYATNQDALSADDPIRNAVTMGRTNRLDKIMYDEDGNQRDLRGAGKLIQKEARRQAKEDQRGGVAWALGEQVTQKEDYDKMIDDMAKKDDLDSDQAEWLKSQSYSQYASTGGLGLPNVNGTYSEEQLYKNRAITPAQRVNISEVGAKLGNGAGKVQIQAAGMSLTYDENGRPIHKISDREFVGKDGRYRQTGTVMTTSYERIYGSVYRGLASDTKLIQYLKQRAQIEGVGQDSETQEDYSNAMSEYINEKLMSEADRTAKHEMTYVFSPKLMDDWILKKQVQHKYDRAIVELEKFDPGMHIVMPTNSQQNNVEIKPGELKKRTTDLNKTIASANDVINTLKNSNKGRDFKNWSTEEKNKYKEAMATKRKSSMEIRGIKKLEERALEANGQSIATISASAITQGFKTMLKNNPDATTGGGFASEGFGNFGRNMALYILKGEAGVGDLKSIYYTRATKLYKNLSNGNTAEALKDLSPEQIERMNEIARGKIPKVMRYGHQGGNANVSGYVDGGKGKNMNFAASFAEPASKVYEQEYDYNLKAGARKGNNAGAFNFREEGAVISATNWGGENKFNDAYKTIATKAEINNFAGFKITAGAFEGQDLNKSMFIEAAGGNGEFIPGSVEVAPAVGNYAFEGGGGESNRYVTAKVKLPSGKVKTVTLKTGMAPGVSHTVHQAEKEAAIEAIHTMPTQEHTEQAYVELAIGTQIIGNNMPIVNNIYNAGAASMDYGDVKEVYDDYGVLKGAIKRTDGGYTFYHARGTGENTYVRTTKENAMRDDRTVTIDKKGSDADVYVFPTLNDMVQKFGEDEYESGKTVNRYSQHAK
jgi:hypothetical protein